MNEITTHEIHIDGHKLAALAVNPDACGAPNILLHGIAASINFWGAEQFSFFCRRGPTYALSLPGHYPAVFPPDLSAAAITPDLIGRLLTAAIHRLVGRRPVTLVGHSTGGFAALIIASFAPESVKRVISIGGFAQGKWIGALGVNQYLARKGAAGKVLFKAGLNLGRISRPVFRAFWRVHLADGRSLNTYEHLEPLIDKFYPDYRQLDLEAMLKYFKVMPDLDITPALPRIHAPILALCGDKDPTVPPAQSYLIAEKAPQADLVVLKDGGHFLFMEKPDDYQRVLHNWLEKTGN